MTNIPDRMFQDDINMLTATIGPSIIGIGIEAYKNCANLPVITIPASVTSIGANAFDKCSKLTSVYFLGNGITVDNNPFTAPFPTIYVTSSSTGWASSFSGCTVIKVEILTPPTASSIVASKTLTRSTLTGGTATVQGAFNWFDSSIVPGITGSQTAIFNPTDPILNQAPYLDGLSTQVTVTISPPVVGVQLPTGIKTLNPYPVDAWSGPYDSVDVANDSIKPVVRYKTMIVRIVNGASSDLYWYRNGTADTDLVLFNSFASDIQMSLPVGGTFGKYTHNAIIPAIGKTPQQVMLDALRQAQNPNPTVRFDPTIIPFNSTSAVITIEITRNILNAGATASVESLKWRNTSADNTTYFDLTSTKANATSTKVEFTHSIPTLDAFRTGSFTYQYYIKDNQDSYATKVFELKIDDYVAPTMTNVTEPSLIREIGDVRTVISGTVTKGSTNVALTNSILQFNDNNDQTFRDLTNTGTVANISLDHNPTYSDTYPTSISYRVKAFDTYKNLTVASTSPLYTINFYKYIYYGSFLNKVDSTNPTKIKQLTSFFETPTSSKVVYIDTGTNKSFVIAMPSPNTLDSVFDETATQSITGSFSPNIIQIPTANNNISISYNVYICNITEAYSPKHIFRITTH